MFGFNESIVIFDTEFTAWPGSQERGWSESHEFREIIQIGAVRLNGKDLREVDSIDLYVKPRRNPELSPYIIDLTGISQNQIDSRGLDFLEAMARFAEWVGDSDVHSYGNDKEVLEENCMVCDVSFPMHDVHFRDICDVFRRRGIDVSLYHSGTIIEAFGVCPQRRPHNSLNDVRNIVDALRMLSMR